MTEKQNKANAEWEKFGHLFKRQSIPSKTILLKEGKIAKKIFYIEKGCIRLSFITKKAKTSHFSSSLKVRACHLPKVFKAVNRASLPLKALNPV